MTKLEYIIDYLRKNPEMQTRESTKEVATKLRVSERHVRRAKALLTSDVTYIQTPKILLLDIETSPIEALTWGLFKQNISPQNMTKPWAMLCWCAKWLFTDTVMGECVTGNDAVNRDDLSIMGGLHTLMEEADIVIAHNAIGFDIPRTNTRFMYNNFPPVSPYRIIDTYRVARKQFSFPSSQLDELARFLGLTRKANAPHQLWYNTVVYGDNESLKKIYEYCIRDVNVLEEVYVTLRPWIKSHPNMNLYVDTDKAVCPTCGSDDLEWRGDYYYTIVGKYKAFVCQTCGAIGRSRFTEIKPEQRENIIISTAR